MIEQVPVWLITYQDTPTNFTQPHRIIVQAENRLEAVCVAADELTRRGMCVKLSSLSGEGFWNAKERAEFNRRFPRASGAKTLLGDCVPYNPEVNGKVLAG